MFAIYPGSSTAINILGSGALAALQPVVLAQDQDGSAALSAFESTPPEQRWMTLSDCPGPRRAAASNFAGDDSAVETIAFHDERSIGSGSTPRGALTAVAGVATAIGMQGCSGTNEEAGGDGISTGGWIAFGVAIPVVLIALGMAGVRGMKHLERRRIEAGRRAIADSIERDIEGWPDLDSKTQERVLQGWLRVLRTNGRDVESALERVAPLPNTDCERIARYLSVLPDFEVVSSSMHYFLPHLDYSAKRFIACASFRREVRTARMLCMDVLESMSSEEQDRWIGEQKSPLLLYYVRRKLPEAYERFRKGFFSESAANADAITAAMIPEIIEAAGLMSPHQGPHGGPGRFTRALQRRLGSELVVMEDVYMREIGNRRARCRRDWVMEERIKLIDDIVKEAPESVHAHDLMRGSALQAARLMLLIAVQPYPPEFDPNGKKLPLFRPAALSLLARLLGRMDTEKRGEFIRAEWTLFSQLSENERDRVINNKGW